MTRLPQEAQEGVMRAWLAILCERHPGVSWVPLEREQGQRGRSLAASEPAARAGERLTFRAGAIAEPIADREAGSGP